MASGDRRIIVPASSCSHPRPTAEVIVRYFPALERHVACVRLECSLCGTPFKFIGPSKAEGYSLTEPVVTPDSYELRAPLEAAQGLATDDGGRIIRPGV